MVWGEHSHRFDSFVVKNVLEKKDWVSSAVYNSCLWQFIHTEPHHQKYQQNPFYFSEFNKRRAVDLYVFPAKAVFLFFMCKHDLIPAAFIWQTIEINISESDVWRATEWKSDLIVNWSFYRFALASWLWSTKLDSGCG